MTDEKWKEMADEFVRELFVNGCGFEAERLVLTTKAGNDIGGWCRGAVRDRVLSLLARVDAEAVERCAKVCDDVTENAVKMFRLYGAKGYGGSRECASAIRATLGAREKEKHERQG